MMTWYRNAEIAALLVGFAGDGFEISVRLHAGPPATGRNFNACAAACSLDRDTSDELFRGVASREPIATD
jgi:hypothetical protein